MGTADGDTRFVGSGTGIAGLLPEFDRRLATGLVAAEVISRSAKPTFVWRLSKKEEAPMGTNAAHELRYRAEEWRAAAARVSSVDPQAARALSDLAARLDRQVFMLELGETSARARQMTEESVR
jgi:hypothetical protein